MEQLALFPAETVPSAPSRTDDGMVTFSFCLPAPEAAVLKRRAGSNISAYMRKWLSYELHRDHHKQPNKPPTKNRVVNERGDGETR